MKKNLFILIFCFILQGCFITNTPGFYSGFSKLTPVEKEIIIFTEPDFKICKLDKDSFVYAINGKQLLECVKLKDSAIVYLWSPNCHGDKCYSLNLVQEYCTKNNYSLFVIAEYYDIKKINLQKQYLNTSPMFSINEKYYKTHYCNKYFKLFLTDLLVNKIINKKDMYNNYFIFNKGILMTFNLELNIK